MADTDSTLEDDESHRLISSARVTGTAVYDGTGKRLGSLDSVMIDKLSGRVEYVVLTFGGFLGLGTERFPLPWQLLRYDTANGGYVVELDRSLLESGPRYLHEEPRFDRGYEERLQGYYGITFPV